MSAEDTEKKFNSIMQKIIPVPKPPSISSSNSTSSSRKRPNPNSNESSVLGPNKRVQSLYGNGLGIKDIKSSPQCRPWDRADFIKRLATFKSMTWFGKPKVVDAVNCARRGWINVELDVIACESCGARLLFSTPASWSHQQVEKAALVFSLKLDNGHKLSCPWIDNSCDEKLAQFPPMADQELVDGYKQRLLALSELLALPAISMSAISLVKRPEFEQFFQNETTLECDDRLGDELKASFLSNGSDIESTRKYYEAQKIISLCGWEPRSLPYVVDCENQSTSKPIADTLPNFSESNGGGEICVHSKSNPQETTETEDLLQLDPNASVLDCKLCGASVGLWSFAKIPRPLEFQRFVGYSDVNGLNSSEVTVSPLNDKTDNSNNFTGSPAKDNSATSCGTFPKVQPTSLNLTIAGGPPPAKQSFRAKISLPAIGHSIRARLFSDQALGSCNPEAYNHEQNNNSGKPQPYIHSSVEGQTSTMNPDETAVPTESHGITILVEDGSSSVIPIPAAHEYVREKDVANKSAISAHGIDLKQFSDGKTNEFDPVRQHRHFCPWITSTSRSSPGWKLVLTALLCRNGSHLSPSPDITSLSKFIEVDDPISSIRKLFASPSPNRKKQMPGAS